MAQKQKDEHAKGKINKTAVARNAKATAPKGAKPFTPPQQPAPSLPRSRPDLEARLYLFSVDLGQDETLNAVFTTTYLENSGDWEAVSAELDSKKVIDPNAIKKLEFTHHLAAWSGDNVKLVRAFQKDDRTNSMRDIAANFSRKEFSQLVSREKAHGKGQTAKMLADNLYNDLFHLQSTAMLQRMVEDPKETPIRDKNVSGNVARFLANQPETFNIKTTSVYEAFKNEDAFKGIAPEHHAQIKTELKSLQRVAAISPVPEVLPVLMKANLTSAMMVSDMPEGQFVLAVSKQLGNNGETVARQIHTNAVNARIRNEQALISLKEVREGTGIAMVDKSMRPAFDDNVFEDTLQKNNLSWDLLFGDADFCECEECTSVYSAAAYFVDLLQYLRNNNLDPSAKDSLAIRSNDPKDISNTPLEKLFNRRPDLKCLQLTCKNTNTKLPYVDLVNEVMENYVAFQKTKSFNVGEDETSGELLAEPHHTEYKAYEVLHDAVYPFTLPYHQPIDAARINLNYLGTSRYEVINTFRSARTKHLLEPLSDIDNSKTLLPRVTDGSPATLDNLYKDYLDRATDAEYLGLTQEEYVILTKEAFVSKVYWDRQRPRRGKIHTQAQYLAKIGDKSVQEYYGYPTESEMLSADESQRSARRGLTFVKDAFLKRTGLQYLELVELLKTQCLNPKMPKEQALSIMDSIRFSYRFLQSLVNQNPEADTPEKKYETVIGFLMAQNFRIDDPCDLEEVDVPQTEEEQRQKEEELKQWVYEYFETVGKIIILDDSVKCIDGKIFRSSDGRLVDAGIKIENCQIINEVTHVVVGSIDKTTGLVTLKEEQPNADGSTIIFIGNKVENGIFVNVRGKYYLHYLVTTKIDACDLETIRLIHLDGSSLTVHEYDHIHRFIRLWRKLGWTINETDNALVGLSEKKDCDISPQLLHQLAAVKKLYEKTGLEQIKLLSFWTNISTVGEKSLYKRLFLTHNLLGIDRVFHADENGLYLAGTTLKILEHVPVLMAALNLRADDVDAIKVHEDINDLTIESVSKLYRYRLLSNILGLRIPDFIRVLPLFGNPFTNADATLFFLENWGRMEDAGFTHSQLNYIIRNQEDPKEPLALTQKMALQLAKNLYDGLNAIEAAHQDLFGNIGEKKTLATAELVKEKAALLYDQVTAEKIIGILEGTTIYSAVATKNIKDLLRPIPSTTDPSTTDYEFLQLDNYPLLKQKIRYDTTNGSIQIKGVLTDFEEKGSSKFFTDDITDLSSLVTKLTGSDPLSKYLWSTFSVSGRNTIATASLALKKQEVAKELNDLITNGALIFDATNFNLKLSEVAKALRDENPVGDELTRLNRLLLEDAYPLEIAKNKRVGLNTILENLLPNPINGTLKDSLASIENQQTKFFHEVFDGFVGVFASPETADLLIGDINDLPIDLETNIDNNTAPLKRMKFLEIILPSLRKELTHRFIVNTLSSQAGLGNDVTDLLITQILKTSPQFDKPVYDLFESIKEAVNPGSTGWGGYLIPSAEEQYTFIVKGSTTKPELSLEGGAVDFKNQTETGSPQEWWSDDQKLQAGKVYRLNLIGMQLEKVYWKTATSSITSIPSTSLLPGYAEDTTKQAYAYLQKAALLINGFKLSADEIQYISDPLSGFKLTAAGIRFMSDPSSNLGSLDFKLEQFLRLESYTRLRNSLPQTKTNILEFFKWATDPDDETRLTQKIAEVTLWKKASLDGLITAEHFNINQAKAFLNEINLLRLQKALEVADKTGMGVDSLYHWANPNSDFEACRKIADGIQHAIRAQYKQEDWEQLVKPLNDKLRENQKNALIAYLLVLTRVMEWGVTDADGLFEFFLIDVQTDPCMETSRIVQAISSVQLFVQRCFLGLEEELRHSDIKPNLLDRKRWEWMQRYRVWEANRKVFLYPENWIESNLRDDKSAFFKELESELLQKDINKQNVEDALKAYLYKVDEVANMEVVGVYIEEGEKLHVFSRTRIAPYFFYYRYLDIAAGNWYPWEKVQVDIPSYDVEDVTEIIKDGTTYTLNPRYKTIIGNGCYLTPIVWNERLLIFFLSL